MSKVLIIGGGGYIGTSLAEKLIRDGHGITIFDSLMYGNESLQRLEAILSRGISTANALLIGMNSHSRFENFELVKGDTRYAEDLKRTFAEGRFDYVFHFGELVGTYSCAKDPKTTEEINFKATSNVAKLAAVNGAVFIYNSSSSVYKATQHPTLLLGEDTKLPPLHSLDDYCKNTVKAEKAIKSTGESHTDFRYIVLRPATVGGLSPRMRIDLLPNQFTLGAMTLGKIHIDSPNDYRAVIDIGDIVDFYARLLKSLPPNGIYNIGHHNLTKSEFVNAIVREVSPRKVEILPSIQVHGDPRNLRISSDKLETATGFVPTRDFRETIRPLVQLLQEHPTVFEKDRFKGFINMTLDDFLRMLNQ